jgi:hypothetical protein
MKPTEGFKYAGLIRAAELNLIPADPPEGRFRHKYGSGPFAKLEIPPLPDLPGVYLWVVDNTVVYVGKTDTSLRTRLGSRGYATISKANTLARQAGHHGGQQTNCRINTLANTALNAGQEIALWYRVTPAKAAAQAESVWMRDFGCPSWNRRDEHLMASAEKR